MAGEVTAFGTGAVDEPAAADAEVVRRLRAAGAVILGKTHVPELTITPFTESPTFGVTRNPWDLQRTPGGSSGGSAAAVAAGLAAPRSAPTAPARSASPPRCCGLFGLKPQRGRVPTAPWSSRGTGCRSGARSPAACSTARASTTRSATAATRSPRPRSASRAGCGSRSRARSPTGVPAPPDAEQLGGVGGDRDAAARARARGRRPRARLGADGVAEHGLALPARDPRRGARRWPHPERLSRRTRGYMRLGGAIPSAAVARARAQAAADTERIGQRVRRRLRRRADADVHPPRRRGCSSTRGAPRWWTVNGIGRLVPYHGAVQPHGPAGGRGPRRLHRRRLPAVRAARRPARRRGRAALARRPARARARLARPPAAVR